MVAFILILILCRCSPEVVVVRGLRGDLPSVERRVEEHLERAERLTTPLRLHAEQYDPAVPVFHVERRCVPLHMLLTEEVPRQKG